MKLIRLITVFLVLTSLICVKRSYAQEPGVRHTKDLIYAKKDGVALTMDVIKPKKANAWG